MRPALTYQTSRLCIFGPVVTVALLSACSAVERAHRALEAGDPDRGRGILTAAAGQGDAAAVRELGILYLRGRGVPSNPDIALRHLTRAAAAGDAPARAEIAWEFLAGSLDDPDAYNLWIDSSVALEWLARHAQDGDAEAACRLALSHLDGRVAVADPSQGLHWLRRGAAAGSATAQRRLGAELVAGKIERRDLKEAEKWLTRAAAAGDCASQEMLARLQAGDFGGEVNETEAVRWFRTAATYCQHGDRLVARRAQARLGIAYRDGIGVNRDAAKAEEWLGRAALNGDGEAQRALGQIYMANPRDDANSLLRRGEALERSWLGFCDMKGAAACYERAASLGNAQAAFRLGALHYGQYRVMEEDQVASWRHAERWLIVAGEAGVGDAMFLLGTAYLRGANDRGIREDRDTALRWLERAANKGHAAAQTVLARAIAASDPERAASLLRSASGAGDPDAAFSLGRCYEEGSGTKVDHRQARRWYREAAQGGVTDAAVKLALMYRRGDGGAPDPEAAEAWLRWAADRGDGEARRLLSP